MTTTAANPAWSTNTSLTEIAGRVRSCRRLACFTHSKPDGDAIGATLALARTAMIVGRQAVVVFLPPYPERFKAVLRDTPVIHEYEGCWSRPELTNADAVAVLDTGSWNQVEDAREFIQARTSTTFIVDHHAHGHPDMAANRYIDTAAASCCEIVAELCRIILGLASVRELPREVAKVFYLGVATDTGWFRYSNTSPKTLRLAADLIDAGAPHTELYQLSEQNDVPSRLRVMARALNNLRLLDNNRVALMSLSRKDFEEAGAETDDAGGLSDLPNAVATVRVVATLIEQTPNLTKLSLRSKPARSGERLVDVNRIAQQFDGGGHVHAAGAKLRMPLDQAIEAVIKALT